MPPPQWLPSIPLSPTSTRPLVAHQYNKLAPPPPHHRRLSLLPEPRRFRPPRLLPMLQAVEVEEREVREARDEVVQECATEVSAVQVDADDYRRRAAIGPCVCGAVDALLHAHARGSSVTSAFNVCSTKYSRLCCKTCSADWAASLVSPLRSTSLMCS
jgi:hypothetical protein